MIFAENLPNPYEIRAKIRMSGESTAIRQVYDFAEMCRSLGGSLTLRLPIAVTVSGSQLANRLRCRHSVSVVALAVTVQRYGENVVP